MTPEEAAARVKAAVSRRRYGQAGQPPEPTTEPPGGLWRASGGFMAPPGSPRSEVAPQATTERPAVPPVRMRRDPQGFGDLINDAIAGVRPRQILDVLGGMAHGTFAGGARAVAHLGRALGGYQGLPIETPMEQAADNIEQAGLEARFGPGAADTPEGAERRKQAYYRGGQSVGGVIGGFGVAPYAIPLQVGAALARDLGVLPPDVTIPRPLHEPGRHLAQEAQALWEGFNPKAMYDAGIAQIEAQTDLTPHERAAAKEQFIREQGAGLVAAGAGVLDLAHGIVRGIRSRRNRPMPKPGEPPPGGEPQGPRDIPSPASPADAEAVSEVNRQVRDIQYPEGFETGYEAELAQRYPEAGLFVIVQPDGTITLVGSAQAMLNEQKHGGKTLKTFPEGAVDAAGAQEAMEYFQGLQEAWGADQPRQPLTPGPDTAEASRVLFEKIYRPDMTREEFIAAGLDALDKEGLPALHPDIVGTAWYEMRDSGRIPRPGEGNLQELVGKIQRDLRGERGSPDRLRQLAKEAFAESGGDFDVFRAALKASLARDRTSVSDNLYRAAFDELLAKGDVMPERVPLGETMEGGGVANRIGQMGEEVYRIMRDEDILSEEGWRIRMQALLQREGIEHADSERILDEAWDWLSTRHQEAREAVPEYLRDQQVADKGISDDLLRQILVKSLQRGGNDFEAVTRELQERMGAQYDRFPQDLYEVAFEIWESGEDLPPMEELLATARGRGPLEEVIGRVIGRMTGPGAQGRVHKLRVVEEDGRFLVVDEDGMNALKDSGTFYTFEDAEQWRADAQAWMDEHPDQVDLRYDEPASLGPSDFRAKMTTAFNLTSDQAAATEALVDAMGLDKSTIEPLKGGTPGEGALLQEGRDLSPLGFYDNILEALKTWQPRGTPDQVKAFLKKIPGATEEAKWIGLDDFLEGKVTVSREEVAEYVRRNRVEVKEDVLGKATPEQVADANISADEAIERYDRARTALRHATGLHPREIRDYIEVRGGLNADLRNDIEKTIGQSPGAVDLLRKAEAAREDASRALAEYDAMRQRRDTKYGDQPDLRLPGGENYREILLQLPEGGAEARRLSELRDMLEEISALPARETTWRGEDRGAAWDRLMGEFQRLGGRPTRQATDFTGGHFGTKNVLAHVRVTDRKAPEGGKALFIEELQSDWAQKGRKEGFSGEPARLPPGWSVRRITERDVQELGLGLRGEEGVGDWGLFDDTPDGGELMGSAGAALSQQAATRTLIRDASAAAPGIFSQIGGRDQGVPPAPFVTRTTDWVRLALRRMIRYAVENGYDSIGWTTGEQQTERYASALRKRVDRIEWEKTPEGVQIRGLKRRVPGYPLPSELPTPLRNRIRALGNLGFDTTSQAAHAILTHDDWATRWDFHEVDPETMGEIAVWRERYQLPDEEVVNTRYREDELSDAIGNAMADRIRQDPAQSGVLEGSDITVSDTGMAGFYDRIMVQEMDKLTKKLGGKVERQGIELEVSTPRAPEMSAIGDFDWDTYAGAENFTDGSRPMFGRGFIRHGDSVLPVDVIAAREGLSLVAGDADAGTTEFRLEWHAGPTQAREVIKRLWDNPDLGTWHKFEVYSNDLGLDPAGLLGPAEQVGPVAFHAIAITPAMRKAAEGGFPLFQKGAEGPKGSAEFAADGKAIIRGFERADVSTGIHEIAHVARRRLLDRSLDHDARRGISDSDIRTAEEWAGAKDGVWGKKAEEKFARGFEKYLRDGQAPSDSLKRIFEAFKVWLHEIYQRLKGSEINVKISKEMRQVFDRLVTREDRLRADTAMPEGRATEAAAAAAGTLPAAAAPHTLLPIDEATKYIKWAKEGSADSSEIGRIIVGAYLRQIYTDFDTWRMGFLNALGENADEHTRQAWKDSGQYLEMLKKHREAGGSFTAGMGFDPMAALRAARDLVMDLRGKRQEEANQKDAQMYMTAKRIYDRVRDADAAAEMALQDRQRSLGRPLTQQEADALRNEVIADEKARKQVEGWDTDRAAAGVKAIWKRRGGRPLDPDEQSALTELEAIYERGHAEQGGPPRIPMGPVRRIFTGIRTKLYGEFIPAGEADRYLQKAYNVQPLRPRYDKVLETQAGAAAMAEAAVHEFRRDVLAPLKKAKSMQEITAIAKGAYQKSMDHLLDMMVESGRMSAELKAKIRETNDFYAPFRVIKHLEDREIAASTGRTIPGTAELTKAIVGIHHEDFGLADLFKSSEAQIVKAVILAQKNKKMLELSEMAKWDTRGDILRRLKSGESPRRGYDVVTYLENGEPVQMEIVPEVARSLRGLSPGETNQAMKLALIVQAPLRFGTITANLGFQVANVMTDQVSAMLIGKYGLGASAKPGIVRTPAAFVADIARWPIELVNAFYSSATEAVGRPNKTVLKWMQSGAMSSTLSAWLREEMRLHPPTRGPLLRTRKATRGVLDSIGAISQALDQMTKGMMLGRGMRIEGIDRITDPAMRERKMAEIVTEVRRYGGTPDYMRQGEYIKGLSLLKAVFMFLPVRLQGAARDMSRLAFMPEAGGWKAALPAHLRLAGTIGAGTIYLYHINHLPENAEDYKAVPDWEKMTYAMFPQYDDNGQPLYFTNEEGQRVREYFKLPVKETLRLYKNMIESVMTYMRDEDPEAFRSAMTRNLDDLSPVGVMGTEGQLSPFAWIKSTQPLIRLPAEMYMGKSTFTGRDIVPESLQDIAPEEQYTTRTHNIYIEAAKPLSKLHRALFGGEGVSPMEVQHVVEGMFGTLPRSAVAPEPIPGRSEWSENVVGRRFWRSTQVNLEPLYDAYRPGERAYNTIRKLVKEGRIDEARTYAQEHEEDLVAYHVLKPIKERIAEIRKRARAKTLPPNVQQYSDLVERGREILRKRKAQRPQ